MPRCKVPISVAIVALVLAWLWPPGFMSDFASTGLSPETIATYQQASSTASFPSASLIFIALFLFVGIFERMILGKSSPRFAEPVLLFGVYWISLGLISELLGAPFVTGDSSVYLRQSVAPWEAFGGHHPSGTMWMLWVGAHLGLPISATYMGLGALEATILHQLFRVRGKAFLAGLIVLLMLIYPDILILRMSVWSEPVMFAGLVVTSFALTRRGVPSWLLVGSTIILFLALCEVRHATIFLLPGFVLALAVYLSGRRFSRFCVLAVCLAASFVAAWLGLNFLRTGIVTAPSRGSFECVHFIAAYHRIPFCASSPTLPLCVADPNDSFLQQGSGKAPSFVELDRFIFHADSPLTHLALSPEEACTVWNDIRRDILQHHKSEVLSLLLRRVLSQFGAWEVSEKGAAIAAPLYSESGAILDLLSDKVNRNVQILWLLWASALIVGIKSRQLHSPVVLFLVVGALGHAFGIALNNPFLGLRYLAVPKYMLSLASLLILFRATSQKHFKAVDDEGEPKDSVSL